jgi:hypothetical protein
MRNPYVMNMIAKERQAEIRRRAEMYRQIRDANKNLKVQSSRASALALYSMSLLTIFFVIIAIS